MCVYMFVWGRCVPVYTPVRRPEVHVTCPLQSLSTLLLRQGFTGLEAPETLVSTSPALGLQVRTAGEHDFSPRARDWTWVLQSVQQTLWHLNCLPQSPRFPMLLAENVCISQNTKVNTQNIYNTEIISQCLNFKNKPLKHKTWVLKSVLVPKTQQYFTN